MKNKIFTTLTLILIIVSITACGTAKIENNKQVSNTEKSIIEETNQESSKTSVNTSEEVKIEDVDNATNNEEIKEKTEEVETSSKDADKDVAGEMTFNVTDTNKTMYSTTSLNVRDLPDASANKIGTYSFNDEVNITGICDNGWVRVNYNNSTAYVKESYLSDDKVQVQKQPSTNSETNKETTQATETPQETVVVGKQGTYDENKAREAFDIVNQIRADNGLGTLTWDSGLVEPAKIRAAEASITWSHTRPDGSAWYTVSGNIQGENLAKGYDSAQDAVNAWMASQGHKENILRGSFTRSAIAFFNTDNGWFWCQAFGY